MDNAVILTNTLKASWSTSSLYPFLILSAEITSISKYGDFPLKKYNFQTNGSAYLQWNISLTVKGFWFVYFKPPLNNQNHSKEETSRNESSSSLIHDPCWDFSIKIAAASSWASKTWGFLVITTLTRSGGKIRLKFTNILSLRSWYWPKAGGSWCWGAECRGLLWAGMDGGDSCGNDERPDAERAWGGGWTCRPQGEGQTFSWGFGKLWKARRSRFGLGDHWSRPLQFNWCCGCWFSSEWFLLEWTGDPLYTWGSWSPPSCQREPITLCLSGELWE